MSIFTKESVENLKFVSMAKAKRDTGLSYIGTTNSSAKIAKAGKFNELTYIIYLSPANSSGFNVCAGATKECIDACLTESGHARIDTSGRIKNARINKTKLFYYNREFFMAWVIEEIRSARLKAKRNNMRFSIRINGTSDISLKLFKYKGLNLLQLFPDVPMYDYTKVFKRIKLQSEYPNYHLTYSYSGENWSECEIALKQGVNVAVVFLNELPETYKGYKVINGDISDLRYKDPKGVIVGLSYKLVKGDKSIDKEASKFIVTEHLKQLV